MQRPALEIPDISEHGAARDGEPQRTDRRLFMQLLVYGTCLDPAPLITVLKDSSITGVLYEDLNDPRGVALLSMSPDPGFFVGPLRQVLNGHPFCELDPKPRYTMFGRTYALGYEPDLEETLFVRPRRNVLTRDWPWAIWYPLRRSGAFARLSADEQLAILREHGSIGMSFGAADFAHDVRLACHGLDAHDNDFVIGLTGKDLHPLSALVQTMRKTQQTALYLERLGPFFVGRAVWQSPNPESAVAAATG